MLVGDWTIIGGLRSRLKDADALCLHKSASGPGPTAWKLLLISVQTEMPELYAMNVTYEILYQ